MHRSLHCPYFTRDLAGLILKQVDSVAGVVPQQVIRPAPRFALCIQVAPAKKEGLHVKVLQRQFARANLFVDPLVTGIKSPRVPDHCHESGFLLHGDDAFCIGKRFRHRNFDLHMFACLHDCNRLAGMNRRWRRENCCLDSILCKPFFEISSPVRHSEFIC